jgi:hypothetical protein
MAVTSFTESDAVASPRALPAPDDGPEPRALRPEALSSAKRIR